MYMSGVLTFAAGAQDTSLDHLTLVASGAYVLRSHRTVTNGEAILNWLSHSQGTAQITSMKYTPVVL